MGDGLRIALLGSREFSRQILSHLHSVGWNVVLAIGAEGGLAASQAGHTSMAEFCQREGIPYVGTDDIRDEDVRTRLEAADPVVGLCCGWTQIVPEAVLGIPDRGFWGLHASSLPEGRGGAPVNWQLIHGEDRVGLSLFEFVPEVDHGDVVDQTVVPVEPRDDVATVYDRVTLAAFELLDRALGALARGDVEKTPQRYADATYLPQRKPEDGLIDWGRPALEQWNWIRALTKPYPGAFTFVDGRKLTVWDSSLVGDDTDATDGEIIDVEPGRGVDVATGGEVLRLDRVQVDSGPAVWADELELLAPGTIIGRPADFPDWLYTGIRDSTGGVHYVTNVQVGDAATFRAVCCSHGAVRDVEVDVTLDGARHSSSRLTVDGWCHEDVVVRPSTSGPHTLTVAFSEGGTVVDTRTLKLYASSA